VSQPCSAVELVLFDARGLTDQRVRADVETVVSLGVLAGAVMDDERVAQAVDTAGLSNRFGFWLGDPDGWPFERAMTFANVEPQRILFVSDDPLARQAAARVGLQVFDDRTSEIAALLP
jgi:hypothetical protein